MTTYTEAQLKDIFQKPYNDSTWTEFLEHFFAADELRQAPENLGQQDTEDGYCLGCINTNDSYRIGLFCFDIKHGSVANKRVGLRNLVRSYINTSYGQFDAALAVFRYADKKDTTWRLSFICDIKDTATAPKRFTYVFGDENNQYRTPIQRFIQLQTSGISFENIKEAFSVEALSKDFYNKLYSWYQWALSEEAKVTFPNNPETEKDDRENLHVKLIRLITRMLFVWFIKQKKLVPDVIFDPQKLRNILVEFDATSVESGSYYNAILQNLFFATLNCAITDEESNPRRFAESQKSRDTRNLYRYREMFKLSEKDVVHLFARIPFLNGGLFECLDKPKDLFRDLAHDILYDGFSRNGTRSANGRLKYRAFIPNILFFNEDEDKPGLITLFKQYNFTIEENSATDAEISLDPELLGQVFENLLASYNPETQETARKSTGSFYTPREVVDYMVDESLKNYLIGAKIDGFGTIGNNEKKAIFEELFFTHSASSRWSQEMIDGVTAALKGIKILDPACGSGAFPMGCMLRIVEIIELLNSNAFDRYDLKLSIIENCIFGVDIQPIAMLICKLRFFISLICEQKEINFNDPAHNYGINTLPNLETKFVAANTLMNADVRRFDEDLMYDTKLRDLQEQLLEIRRNHLLAKGRRAKRACQIADKKKRDEIQDYIVEGSAKPNETLISHLNKQITLLKSELKQYEAEVWVDATRPVDNTLFGPVQDSGALFRKDLNAEKRKEIKASIRKAEGDLKRERSKGSNTAIEAAIKQITDWDPYDQNAVSPFFDPEWMFCMKQKFDIIIGNPPYIQLQKNSGELAKMYEPCGYETFTKTGDIYCLFYERGVQLLKEKGHLCFITSNKWMRAAYGAKTRCFLATHTNPKQLIDFADVKIFESATVDTNILLLAKAPYEHQTLCVVTSKQSKNSIGNLSVFVQQNGSECDFNDSDSWVILSPIEQSIKRKIEAVGTPLKDWDINIYRGVLTGYNEAFIIPTEKREEILANCQSEDERTRTAELIRPILRGRDIKRYGYEWAGLWLINTHNGVRGKMERIQIEDYPAVKAHLDKYWDKISERADKGDSPYNLRNCAYLEDFSKPKIVWGNLNLTASYAMIQDNSFINAPSPMIVPASKFLLAVLNSKIADYYIRQLGVTRNGGYFEYKPMFVEKLPVPQNVDAKVIADIESYVDSKNETAIDEAVYMLYGLTEEERQYINQKGR